MTASAPRWPASPLAAADAAFGALTAGPAPLALDLDDFEEFDRLGPDPDLPGRDVSLPVLRDWLLRHPGAYRARDAVWRELIRRARTDGPEWVIAAVGMAMPALRGHARSLCASYPGDPDDIDAEILTGFLTALRDRVDLSRDAPHAGLCMAAWRAGRELRRRTDRCLPPEEVERLAAGPYPPRPPYGHPDLLVRRAVTLGLLRPEDEDPWIDVRLGRRAPEPIAARLGITVDALRMRLNRIDVRLTDALIAGVLTGAATTPYRAGTRTGPTRRSGGPVTGGGRCTSTNPAASSPGGGHPMAGTRP